MYGSKCRYDHVRPKQQPQAHRPVTLPKQEVPTPSHMTVLQKASTLTEAFNKSWADAPEFVPGAGDDAQEAGGTYASLFAKSEEEEQACSVGEQLLLSAVLCPYAEATGECTAENCPYLHGDKCPCCQRCCMHPDDPIGNEEHLNQCVAEVERGIKAAEAEQLSATIDCGVCLEKVLEKSDLSDRRFGILQNCNHAFCLKCLRDWRTKHDQGSVVRTCPICRTVSYFVVPSSIWVESPEEKALLIDDYRQNMTGIDCKYYRRGDGACPFGDSCFYRHQDKDGKSGPSTRFRGNCEGEYEPMRPVHLWDFLAQRSDGNI